MSVACFISGQMFEGISRFLSAIMSLLNVTQGQFKMGLKLLKPLRHFPFWVCLRHPVTQVSFWRRGTVWGNGSLGLELNVILKISWQNFLVRCLNEGTIYFLILSVLVWHKKWTKYKKKQTVKLPQSNLFKDKNWSNSEFKKQSISSRENGWQSGP